MPSLENFPTKLQPRKLKYSGLSSTRRNCYFLPLHQYLEVSAIGFHGQTVSKSSRRYCAFKSFIHDYWFRLNQPFSVTALVMETSEASDFVLRLLWKGSEKGRYVRSGAEYLPSFEFSDATAAWF